MRFYGLRQLEGEYRTNISITNADTRPGYVWITLFRSDGVELTSYPIIVEPGMVVQDLEPFKTRAGQPNLGWGFAEVWVGYGESGPMLVSASVIDSRTNDVSMVPMTR